MKKIECVIMDWAGTAVDYGCFAPVSVFIESLMLLEYPLQQKRHAARWG